MSSGESFEVVTPHVAAGEDGVHVYRFQAAAHTVVKFRGREARAAELFDAHAQVAELNRQAEMQAGIAGRQNRRLETLQLELDAARRAAAAPAYEYRTTEWPATSSPYLPEYIEKPDGHGGRTTTDWELVSTCCYLFPPGAPHGTSFGIMGAGTTFGVMRVIGTWRRTVR